MQATQSQAVIAVSDDIYFYGIDADELLTPYADFWIDGQDNSLLECPFEFVGVGHQQEWRMAGAYRHWLWANLRGDAIDLEAIARKYGVVVVDGYEVVEADCVVFELDFLVKKVRREVPIHLHVRHTDYGKVIRDAILWRLAQR